jgi:YD repeat-containing protein
VNRLTSVSEGGWSRAYYYDAFGNRAAQGSGENRQRWFCGAGDFGAE